MNNYELDISDSIALISATISLIAMFISILQAHSAKKSLKIQKELYLCRQPNFKFNEIADSCAYINNSNSKVTLKFRLVISNLSDRAMIIENIYLRIFGENNNIILEPVSNISKLNKGTTIKENNAISENVQFDISLNTYKNLNIFKYEIIIKDAYNNCKKQEQIFIREVTVNHEI